MSTIPVVFFIIMNRPAVSTAGIFNKQFTHMSLVLTVESVEGFLNVGPAANLKELASFPTADLISFLTESEGATFKVILRKDGIQLISILIERSVSWETFLPSIGVFNPALFIDPDEMPT